MIFSAHPQCDLFGPHQKGVFSRSLRHPGPRRAAWTAWACQPPRASPSPRGHRWARAPRRSIKAICRELFIDGTFLLGWLEGTFAGWNAFEKNAARRSLVCVQMGWVLAKNTFGSTSNPIIVPRNTTSPTGDSGNDSELDKTAPNN